jgi:hypothetical protein
MRSAAGFHPPSTRKFKQDNAFRIGVSFEHLEPSVCHQRFGVETVEGRGDMRPVVLKPTAIGNAFGRSR